MGQSSDGGLVVNKEPEGRLRGHVVGQSQIGSHVYPHQFRFIDCVAG